MPEFSFGLGRGINPTTIDIGGLEVPTVYVGVQGAWLHRPGADPERFDPRARVLASGVIETEHFEMSGLIEVFGAAVEAVWPDGTDASDYCQLQVSLDGGEAYLAWTGAAWEEQEVDEVFNTLEDFNDHCDSLPLTNPRYVGWRIKILGSADLRQTPLVKRVVSYLEWDYDALIDLDRFVLARLQSVRFPFVVRHRQASLAARVALQTEMVPDFSVAPRVFNLNTDPLKNTNLFSSMDDSTIVLTAAQAAGHVLEVELVGTMPIVLTRQDEFMTKTKVPSLLVDMGAVKVVRSTNTGMIYDYKRGGETKLTRMREFPRFIEVPVQVTVVVAEPRTAKMAIEAIRSAFYEADFVSPETGCQIAVVEEEPVEADTILAEGVETARWSGCCRVVHFLNYYNEYQGVSAVFTRLGGKSQSFETRSSS